MKFTKMSLVAALLVGSSAFALDNVKVSGDAKLYYETVGSTKKVGVNAGGGATLKDTTDIGDRRGSNGQAALALSVTADLAKSVSAGVTLNATNTLGLENSLVGGTWAGPLANAKTTRDGASYQNATANQWWIGEAWLAATAGKTTAKVGRQYLDTPLAFTETWNIAKNSFAAAVLINQDIPDTTLVGAFVGESNGAANQTVANAGNGDSPFTGYVTYNNSLDALANIGVAGAANSTGGAGAYAAGIVNNSFKPLTAQAWYYNVTNVAKAYWLQADVKVEGLMFGAQYANMAPEDKVRFSTTGATADISALQLHDSSALALMAGVELKDIATLKVAYSKTDDKGALNIQNTATGSQSKLYTEAWWNYGYVGMPGTTAYMLSAEGELKDMFGWFAQYTSMNVQPNDKMATGITTFNFASDKISEITVGVTKSFGPLDTSLAYVNTNVNKADVTNGKNSWVTAVSNDSGDYSDNRIQAYLTLNF